MAKRIIVLGTRGIPDVQGGIETHCEELYPRLINMGNEITILARKPYLKEKSQYIYKGVKIIPIYTPKKKAFETIIHSFVGVCRAKKIGCDILHIHAVGPSLVTPFARILGLKVVMTHHGPDYDRQKWGKLAKTFLKLGERFGVKNSNEVIVISNVIKKILFEKYKRNNAQLIYNGITLPQKSFESDYLEKLQIEKGKYIIAVGRFVEEKGFHDLIKAYIKIKDPKCKLVLVGDADHESIYSKKLKNVAKENGVVLTGFIKGEKLNQIFSHAHGFIMPSYHEGLPIALLEAMSYNLRVIVSDIPANLEVALDKDNYFAVGDIDELSIKISKLMVSENTKIEYNLSNYNWDEIASQVNGVYHRLCKST